MSTAYGLIFFLEENVVALIGAFCLLGAWSALLDGLRENDR